MSDFIFKIFGNLLLFIIYCTMFAAKTVRNKITKGNMAKKKKTRPLRFLIVDDHRDHGDALVDVMGLYPDQYVVTTAYTLAEVTDKLKGGEFDVILWDYVFPDGTPFELIAKTRERFQKLRMIARTNNLKNADHFITAGCNIVAGPLMSTEDLLRCISGRRIKRDIHV